MSGTLTLVDLLEVDAAGLAAAAAVWSTLAKGVDDRADDLHLISRRLPEVWDGTAGQRAQAYCAGLGKELDAATVAVLSIAQAVRRHADGIGRLRQHARDLIAEASTARIAFRDGAFHAAADRADVWGAQAAASYAHQAEELLTAARSLDQETARVIAEHTATAAGGPAAHVARDRVPPAGTDPRTVKSWWDGLTGAQRRFVLAEYPDLVGNLDGVPVAARDVANRITLDRDADRLRAHLDDLDARERHIRAMAEAGRGKELYPHAGNPLGAALAELDQISDQRDAARGSLKGIDILTRRLDDHSPGQQPAYLIGFSTADDGRAIVSIGNPDAADNVLTYVPGTGAELSKVRGDLARAEYMADDANQLDPTRTTAAIMWLGYDAPDSIVPGAAQDSYADGARADLRRFQDGLRTTHDGPASHNVVLGHSYGSTVIGHTATTRLDADDLIFVGSPGVGVDSATDLRINTDSRTHVWASTARNDLIGSAGLDDNLIHGENPNNPGFGARTFTSDPGTPQWTWRDPLSFSAQAHSDYWEQNSASRVNIARITVGQDGEVR